jgi:hypothetical protein
VGDGREYFAQATNFSSFHGPAFRPVDIPHVQSQIARFDPDLGKWDMWGATVADAHRGRVFLHFWVYALLATPALWVTNAVGAPPTLAFAALNLVLLGTALWLTLPRIGMAACLLLFGGPILWWIDKAHTEIFTFSLLMITFALMRDRPWWAMIAAGAAATQNPPIAVLVGLVLAASLVRRRFALTDRRLLAGAAGGLSLALLHPIYNYAYHGTPSLLLAATRHDSPTLQSLSAVLFDPTLGLIGNFPLFLIVVAGAILALMRRDRLALFSADILVAGLAAGIFLFSFSRTMNMHHGGTPGLSRYAVWLIPLAVPLLSATERAAHGLWPRFLWTAAVASFLISLFAFHPAVPQNSREPTWLATFLWTRFPAWNNPLPEVFIESELQVADPWVPVSTAGCEKVLVAGRDGEESVWPVPCYPAQLPAECQPTGAMCYANLKDQRYEFTPVPARWAGAGKLRLDAVWPEDAVPHVRRLYEAWNWRSLRVGTASFDLLRAAVGVSVAPLGSEEQFILVLRNLRPGARLQLRPTKPMSGVLVDATTGRTLSSQHHNGTQGDFWNLELPPGFDILLLAMRADGVHEAPSAPGSSRLHDRSLPLEGGRQPYLLHPSR